jgi:hypothetical protein
VSYKRFKLDARFNYSMGGDVYNYLRSQMRVQPVHEPDHKSLVSLAGGRSGYRCARITFQDPMGNSRSATVGSKMAHISA